MTGRSGGSPRSQPRFNATAPRPKMQSRSHETIADFRTGGIADDVRVQFDDDEAHAFHERHVLCKEFSFSALDVDHQAVERKAGLLLNPFNRCCRHFYFAASEPDRRTARNEWVTAVECRRLRIRDDLLTNLEPAAVVCTVGFQIWNNERMRFQHDMSSRIGKLPVHQTGNDTEATTKFEDRSVGGDIFPSQRPLGNLIAVQQEPG